MKIKNERSFYNGLPILGLNWKQPYGTLMVTSNKIETRTWKTNYRGYVLMCASKNQYTSDKIEDISGLYHSTRLFYDLNCKSFTAKDFLGNAFAIGKLVDCRPMIKSDENLTFVQYKEPWEHHTKSGDIIIKRLWCHIYEDIKFINPLNWSAGQGWSFVPSEVLSKIFIL